MIIKYCCHVFFILYNMVIWQIYYSWGQGEHCFHSRCIYLFIVSDKKQSSCSSKSTLKMPFMHLSFISTDWRLKTKQNKTAAFFWLIIIIFLAKTLFGKKLYGHFFLKLCSLLFILWPNFRDKSDKSLELPVSYYSLRCI